MDKILEALESLPEDKWGQHAYFREGKYCVLGWIFHCYGMSDNDITDPAALFERERILHKLNFHGYRLANINDTSESLEEVRRRIAESG
jgi:hypothetical protein